MCSRITSYPFGTGITSLYPLVRDNEIIPLFGYNFVIPFGGDNEIRTHDPLLARQVLSQLSYTPTVIALSDNES